MSSISSIGLCFDRKGRDGGQRQRSAGMNSFRDLRLCRKFSLSLPNKPEVTNGDCDCMAVIEAACHRLDSVGEDRSRIHTGRGSDNITRLRWFAISLIQALGLGVAQNLRLLARYALRLLDFLKMTGNTRKRTASARPSIRTAPIELAPLADRCIRSTRRDRSTATWRMSRHVVM